MLQQQKVSGRIPLSFRTREKNRKYSLPPLWPKPENTGSPYVSGTRKRRETFPQWVDRSSKKEDEALKRWNEEHSKRTSRSYVKWSRLKQHELKKDNKKSRRKKLKDAEKSEKSNSKIFENYESWIRASPGVGKDNQAEIGQSRRVEHWPASRGN